MRYPNEEYENEDDEINELFNQLYDAEQDVEELRKRLLDLGVEEYLL